MRKEMLLKQIIVVMIIGLFLGSSGVPTMAGTPVSKYGTNGNPLPLDTNDVAVTNISVNNPVYKGEGTPVTATIHNAGTADETNVPVNFTLGVTASSSDGFEYYAPMPKGWTLTRTCPTSTWFIYNSTTTQYPKVQETAASGLAQDEWLISPTIDCSAMTNGTIRMYFTKYWNVATGSDSNLTVYGSTDNGATWTKVMYYWAGTAYNSTTVNTTSWWITSWAAGQSNVKIAFRFRSTADTTLTDYFYLDYFFFGQNWGPNGDIPPAGWTIQNYGSETPQVWNWNDWYRNWYGTGASYSGYLARFSSSATPTETTQDEWLITPTLDCSALTNVMLRFALYFSYSTAGVFYVNGSIDGGTTWDKPVARYTAGLTISYPESIFDISSWAAGQSNVKIRFRYYKTGTSSSYGYLDNVRVYSGSTYLLNQKFEGVNGYATNFDYFLSDLTDAWGTYNWKQTPVTYTRTWNCSAYDQFFSVTSGSSPTCSPHGGSRMVQYYGYLAAALQTARFYSGPLNINGLKQLKFWMYHDTTSGAGKAQVQASTDGFTWTNLSTAINRQAGTAGWQQHTIDLSAYYSTPTVRIGICTTSDYNANMYFDDFAFYSDDIANTTKVTKYVDVTSGSSVPCTMNWIPTREGTSKITVLAGPVPGETNLGNNSMNRSVNVLSVPNIWIIPTSYDITVARDSTDSRTLTIGNNGTATLTGTLAKTQTWLTLSSTSVSVVVGTYTNYTVTVDGTKIPAVGDYSDTITITTNDPDESPLSVTVTVHATLPAHDITVTTLTVPGTSHLLETTPITATIKNNGLNDETAIPVSIQAQSQLAEGFETFASGYYMFPSGWTNTSINPAGRWFMYVSGTYPSATTYPKISEVASAQDELLISPVINCAALTQVTLAFTKYLYLATATNTTVQVLGSTDGGATWPQFIYSWTIAGTNNTAVSKDISSWAAGQANVKIAFRFNSPGGASHSDYFYFDDFTVAKVSAALSYDFESTWGPYGDVPPAGWTINTNETPITWDNNNWHKYNYGGTQFNVARVYYSPVRYQNESLITPVIDCSALSSVTLMFWHYFYYYSTLSYGWIDGSIDGGATWPYNVATFHTAIDTGIKTYDITSWAHNQPNVKIRFHYQDHDGEYWDVDNVFVGATTIVYTTPFATYSPDNWGPLGWNQVQTVGNSAGNKFTAMSSGSSPTCSPHGGTKMVQYNSYSASAGNEARFYTTALSLTNVQSMTFWMFHDSTTYQANQDNLSIQISTDGSNWTRVGPYFYRSCTLQGLSLVDQWAQHTVDLSAYSGYSTIYLAFYAHSAYGYNMYFDDMTIYYGTATGNLYTTSIDLTSGSSTNVTFATWAPSVTGIYKIVATAGPVTGEVLTADNTMTAYTTVTSVPNIWISPDSFFDVFVERYSSINETLTIGNDGTSTLTGSISHPSYLTLSTTTINLAAGTQMNVYITNDPLLSIGWHNDTLIITSNDPDENPIGIYFNLEILPTLNNYLSIEIEGSGSVLKVPDQTTYTYGTIVNLTAVPAEGWLFDSWENDITGTDNPTTITMDGDKEVTAVFSITSGYTLSVTTEGNGNVTIDPEQASYDWAAEVTLHAIPGAGYVFDHWEDDLTGTDNPATISMTGSKDVTAVFTIITGLTVDVTIDGSGSVMKDPDQTSYTYGTKVTLTADPAEGWMFDHWEGDATGVDNPTTITMDGNKDVTAVFTVTSGYTLTILKVGTGNVSINPDHATYTYGDLVTLTASTGNGYVFDHWEGDLTGSTNPDTIAMTGSKTVTAVFTIISGLTLTVTTDGQGTVIKDPDQATYNYGQVVTLTADPDDGWTFDHWSGAVTGTTNPATVTMTSNKAVVAHFIITSGYTLTVTVTGSGSVTKDPNHPTYTYGDPVVLTAYPTYGWKFDHWEGDLTGDSNPQTIYMTGSKTVTAVFTLTDGWKLTITIDGQGMVTKDPDQATYTFGDEVVLTAMPDAGWMFNEWTGGLTGSENPATVTMNGDETVTAHFGPNHAPTVPAAPTAPEIAGATVQQTVSAVTTDADGDQILYMFDFGDGTNSSWVGPFASGTPATTTHTWTRDGEFHFKVKAKDTFGHESAWSSATITYMTLTTRMFGSIKQKTTTGNITTFYANFVIFIRPHGGIKILQGMEPIVVPAKHGLVTQSFIMGRFQAALLAPHNIIQGTTTVDDTDLTSLPAGSHTIG
jgi:uncharacterized repeat protein (TIGR02543 family)